MTALSMARQPYLIHRKRAMIWRGVLEKIEYQVMLVPMEDRRKADSPIMQVERYIPSKKSWKMVSTAESMKVITEALFQHWKASGDIREILTMVENGNPD